MTTSTINALPLEQTVQLTHDSFLMQTAAGITKKIQATNMKLVGYNTIPVIWDNLTSSSANPPILTTFRGNIKASAFVGTGATVKDLYGSIEIPTDYVAGTPISFYIKWGHIIVAPTGDVVWQIEYSIAKSNTLQAFPTPTVVLLQQTAGIQYYHCYIAGSSITSADVEAGSLILIHLWRNPAHASDTFANDAYLFKAGINYKTDSRPTNEKVSPFTKV